jgi:hypothetical protein
MEKGKRDVLSSRSEEVLMSTLYLMNPNAEFLLNDYFLAVTIRFQPKCLLKNRKSLLGMTGLNLVAVTFNGIKKFTRATFQILAIRRAAGLLVPLLGGWCFSS